MVFCSILGSHVAIIYHIKDFKEFRHRSAEVVGCFSMDRRSQLARLELNLCKPTMGRIQDLGKGAYGNC